MTKGKFRRNVGIIIMNKEGKLWLGKVTNANFWQFPQGGIDLSEKIHTALYRELFEETGLKESDVKLIAESKKWYSYTLPKPFSKEENIINSDGIASKVQVEYIGQRQKWFLVQLVNDDVEFNLNIDKEFEQYRWVSYWYPIRNMVFFKEDVYRKVLKEFTKHAFRLMPHNQNSKAKSNI